MEKLALKYAALIKSQKAFQRALSFYQKNANSTDQSTREASVVTLSKHFAWFYEMIWKYLQAYFQEKFDAKIVGSKEAFRLCEKRGIISGQELDRLFEIVEVRNIVIHAYDEKDVEKVITAILKYIPTLNELMDSISKLKE